MRDSSLAPGDMLARAPVAWRWLETVLLTAVVPVARFAMGSTDPFGLAWEFPWLVFVPFVLGLQHGSSCAAASLIALGSAAVLHAGSVGRSLPVASVAFAWGAIVLAASRACDASRERCERLRERVLDLELAWERERRAREVLRLSHDKLVQQWVGAPESVDQVLASVGQKVIAMRSVHEFGRCVLDVLVHHAELQEGSVWLEVHSRLVRVAATRGGEGGSAVPGPLAQHAMRTGSAASRHSFRSKLTIAASGSMRPPVAASEAEAVLPLMAADGAVRGVVIVDQMPCEVLVPEAVQRMRILVSGLAASVESATWECWLKPVPPNEEAPRQTAAVAGAWDAIG